MMSIVVRRCVERARVYSRAPFSAMYAPTVVLDSRVS